MAERKQISTLRAKVVCSPNANGRHLEAATGHPFRCTPR
jgi:hypothetical protein